VADASLRGAEALERLARLLKETGNGELRKELLRGIRTAARPMIPQVRAEARRRLPHRGGLAADIAKSKLAVRTRASGEKTGVRISAQGRRSLREIDRGSVRHPVFGNRKVWVGQKVTSGFFTEPLEHDADEVRTALRHVMGDVARRIERGI
jgi:hypothetical protein